MNRVFNHRRKPTARRANTVQAVVVTLATENQIDGEILLMSGLKLKRKRIPIVDSLDDSSIKNVLGIVRDLRVENRKLIGNAVFASDQRSQDAYHKVLDGHLTDFMVSAHHFEGVTIPAGTIGTYRNKKYRGPVTLLTKWQPCLASVVAVSPDPGTRVQTVKKLSAKLGRQLRAKGMPSHIKDVVSALAWTVKQAKIKKRKSRKSTSGV